MTAYQKDSSVFTRSGMGGSPGETSSQKSTKGANVGGGGSILVAHGQDNVHGVDLPDTMGCAMGGSDTSLSHSLSGSSAVQRQRGKVEKSGI